MIDGIDEDGNIREFKTVTGRITSDPEMQDLNQRSRIALVTDIDFGKTETMILLAAQREGRMVIIDEGHMLSPAHIDKIIEIYGSSDQPERTGQIHFGAKAIEGYRPGRVYEMLYDPDPIDMRDFVPTKTRGGQVKDPKPHTHLIPQASLSPRRSRRK